MNAHKETSCQDCKRLTAAVGYWQQATLDANKRTEKAEGRVEVWTQHVGESGRALSRALALLSKRDAEIRNLKAAARIREQG